MIMCSFSDWYKPLDEAPRYLKGKLLHKWILTNLKHRKRVSVWEIDANKRVCRTLMYLKKIGKIQFNNDYDYPYQGVDL